MIELLHPKTAIKQLSDNKIDKKLLLCSLVVWIFGLALPAIVYFDDSISTFKKILEPLIKYSGSEKVSLIYLLIRDSIEMWLIYLLFIVVVVIIINWIIKKVLNWLKKEISINKLLNIWIYAFFCYSFLKLIIVITLILLSQVFGEFFIEWINPLVNISMLIVNAVVLILFVYAIKVSVKNKPEYS